jgi:hypothetical protein
VRAAVVSPLGRGHTTTVAYWQVIVIAFATAGIPSR